MPRARGAASQREDVRRHRGEHFENAAAAQVERRSERHEPEPTTDSFQIFYNQASRHPLLTGPEELELAKAIERGDLAAKDRLINSNLRLVVKFARRYQGHGLSLEDLVQEGMLGLIRASEKFDWRRGYKFSTYAVLWIKQSMQRGIDNSGRQVRIPAHVAQHERTVNRIDAELRAKLERDPTDEEVAEAAQLPLDRVAATRDLTRVTTSLDAPVGDGDTSFGELHGGSTANVEQEHAEAEQEQVVGEALERLPEQQRRVVQLRFGTGGEPALSVRDTARELGVTQKDARKLEAEALEHLADEDSLAAWAA